MNKEVLRLAIPNILSNISVPLISSVDTALTGRLSDVHLGAVGIGAMIFNFLYWNFGFLRMGTTGMTAQAFGSERKPDIIHTLGRAFLVVGAIAAILVVFQVPIGELSFKLMNISEKQYPFIAEYFYIRIWAAPATLGLMALMGWFFGMQNAIYPMILTIIIAAVNIVCSYVFVVHLKWDVAGVAWGTVIAQYVGLIVGVALFFYRYRNYFEHYQQKALLTISELKKFLVINRDIFIRTLCLTLVFGFFYSQSSGEGELILAVNVILLQLVNWMSYGVDGFAFAAESLVGKYQGAKDGKNLRKAIRSIFMMGMGMAVIYSLAYWIFSLPIVGLFTNEAHVIEATLPYLFWMVLFPTLATPCYIWDGIFIGLTASRAMRNGMLLSLIAFVGAYFIGLPYGNHGLWAALLVFMVGRGLIQWWMYVRRSVDLDVMVG